MESNIVKGFKNNLNFVTPPVYQRYTKEELEEIIEKYYGITTIICGIVDCTYKQLYKAIDYYDLREYLADSKKQLVGMAEKAILECLASQNEQVKLRAAETTLKSLGKADGWNFDNTTIQQNINITDKETEIKNIFGI